MKRKIIAALIATLAVTQVGFFAGNMGAVQAMNPNQYTDVVSTNVNYSYIEKMVDKGILDADTDTEFGAKKAMTRQGLLKALYRMAENPLVLDGENTFVDVDYKADNELGRALKWAEKTNLFAGVRMDENFFTENKFEADKKLSRQEAVQIVYNYASEKGLVDTNMTNITLNSDVKDADTVAQWAKTSMKWALVNQFVDVDKEQKINPEKEITKEETAKLLSMYLDMEERIENERNMLATTSKNTPVSNAGNNNATQGNGQTGTETPDIPMTPIEPSTPVEPENPDIPMTPIEPSTPVEKPSIPWIPIEPSTPVEKPSIPWIPIEPSTPVEPHEHHWVDNIVKIEHPEEGHWEKVLVKEAWDEVIQHPEEGHWEKVLVKEAWDEVIQHPEEGHWEKVLVKEAWDEEVPIYEEQIRHICNNCGEDITGNENDHMFEHLNNGELAGWHEEVKNVQVGTDIIHHEAVYEDKWIVDKEAWEETIHHEAVYEDKWIVDKEAWEETIHHEAVYEDKWIVDKEAWEETIHHEAVYEDKWIVDKEAWTEEVVQGQICPDCGATRK
jgi:hypothetical protein